MTSKPKFDPALHDDNPEWTKEMFERARPAKDVLPESILSQFKNKGGRPRIERPKEAIKLRIDADVVEAFRKTGPGWQTRINLMLRSALSDGKIKKVHLAKRIGKISVVGSNSKRKRA
jgi:uncharacterized protein (DUF4415 family)